MKAKVQLTDTYTGRSINIITTLVEVGFGKFVFSWGKLTKYQREKIGFGKKAYYPKIEIIKYYDNYTYYTVIQSNFGEGWNDEVQYDITDKKQMEEYKSDIKAYKQNASENGYRIRVIRRRVKA